jgi:hypothetical protein
MSLGVTIVVIVVLCAILVALVAFLMSRTTNLRPHRRRGGKPPARLGPHDEQGVR